MARIFITGANRGIGLELVRQYLEQSDNQVFAACRQPDQATDLHQLAAQHPAQLHIIPLEVTDDAARQQAVQLVRQHTDALDILINNAAINPPGSRQTLQTIDTDGMLYTLNINSVAPLMMTQAFLDLLKKGNQPRLINISSDMASLTGKDYGGDYAYCTSKAALNMITRGLAVDLRREGIIAICLDPGWVQTDMGGKDASLTPAESVQGIVQVITKLTPSQAGSYLRWNGTILPW
jgi:NAD(P)-dependent dehydrogenase (short-subunit alcohol dehydrogenase family)